MVDLINRGIMGSPYRMKFPVCTLITSHFLKTGSGSESVKSQGNRAMMGNQMNQTFFRSDEIGLKFLNTERRILTEKKRLCKKNENQV